MNPGILGLILVLLAFSGCGGEQSEYGIFERSGDVGRVNHAGRVAFDADTGEYAITASGENIWGERDAFHFVWNQVGGDLLLTASVAFPGEGTNAHRKAGWMVRESLDADSPYADAVIHADGLVSLQYRKEKGGPTEEIQAAQTGITSLRFERNGDLFSLSVSIANQPYEPVGSAVVALPEAALVGLAACSHEPDEEIEAVFWNVGLVSRSLSAGEARIVESSLELFDVEGGTRQVIYRVADHFEAPNWSRDGNYLVFNSHGLLYRIPVEGGRAVEIDTGTATRCNNDHGFSPNGEFLAISHSPEGQSLIYVLPATGGEPRLVTWRGPSYWHGWSPDGRRLAYCAERNGEYDIYTAPVEGGLERRLTSSPGLDDGPDYSPDGKWIYINSVRTGLMKIWRISPDGALQEQVTVDDQFADWFPHPSPDGKWVVFLSYDKSVEGHPPNQEVVLRLMPMSGGEPRILTRFFGGQGTINVPSWSPDSREFAFVSYRLVAPEESQPRGY